MKKSTNISLLSIVNSCFNFVYCRCCRATESVKKAGFTLIELAVVLVVIGLVIGGALVGRNLIHAAEIRAQIGQYEKYNAVMHTFENKFNYSPGDMPPSQATQLSFFAFTGLQAGQMRSFNGNSGSCGYGNNDGYINDPERYVFWRHLSEAGLIEGKYGMNPSTDYHISPKTEYSSICWYGNIYDAGGGGSDLPLDRLDEFSPHVKVGGYNVFILPVIRSTTTYTIYNISNSSARNFFQTYSTTYENQVMDSKIDDGLPLTGSFRELNSSKNLGNGFTGCTVGTYPNLTYNLSKTDANACQPSFLIH